MKAEKGKPVLVRLAVTIIVILAIPNVCPTVQAQTEHKTVFTPADKFETADFNSSIRFAVNGSCSDITLVNGVWTFTNLRLNNSQFTLNNFSISVRDSNVTIFSVRAYNFTGRSTSVRFSVVGTGTQTIDLNPDSEEPTHWSEWSVTVPRSGTDWLSEGENWKLQPDSSVIVWGLTGNVSVTHYVFSGSKRENNLPFYFQHIVTIITLAVLASVVATAIIIQITKRRR